MSVTMKVEGLQEAIRQVRSLRSALEAQHVEAVLLKGARIVRDDARRRVRKKSGGLNKAIRAKKGKRKGRTVADAFAAVDRKKAPHAHLIENGTSRAPAYPFMRPAAEATAEPVAKEVTSGLRELVDKGLRR